MKRKGSLAHAGVYMVLNILTGDRYVGSSPRLVRYRWTEHRCKLRKGTHQSPPIQEAWNTYGEDAFRFILLEAIENDSEKCIEREQHWMNHFKSQGLTLYNVMPYAGTNRGYKHTEKTRAKMSHSFKGRRWTQEQRDRYKKQRANYRPEKSIAAAKARAELGEWPPLLAPSGNVVRITNISEFCRQHGLDPSHLVKVLHGKRRIHKGYTLLA